MKLLKQGTGGAYEAEKVCVECDETYTAHHSRQAFCTKECKKARDKRRSEEYRRTHKHSHGQEIEVTCAPCGKVFARTHYPSNRAPQFCSQACYKASRDGKPIALPKRLGIEKLTRGEIEVIQRIWHSLDFAGLESFLGKRDLHEICKRFPNKSLLYNWVVYTILFQSHLTYKYETVKQVPGFDVGAFHSLCNKFVVRLVDSPEFDSDRKRWQQCQSE